MLVRFSLGMISGSIPYCIGLPILTVHAAKRDRPDFSSRFHHFQSCIKFMPAGRTTDAIRLNRKFIRPDSHATAIRTARQVDPLIIYRFVLRTTETIHWLPIKEPWIPCIVKDRQRHIMMVHIVFKFLPIGEPILNQLTPQHLVEPVLPYNRLGRTHHAPPVLIRAV